jgi:hypothetical protein
MPDYPTEEPMVKDGKVRAGKTPSEFTGKKSASVRNGVAVAKEDPYPKSEKDLVIPLDLS